MEYETGCPYLGPHFPTVWLYFLKEGIIIVNGVINQSSRLRMSAAFREAKKGAAAMGETIIGVYTYTITAILLYMTPLIVSPIRASPIFAPLT